MRPAETYRGARRNKWHETQACRWDESAYRFDIKVKRQRVSPVQPNRRRALEGWPTLRELAAIGALGVLAKRKVAA